MPKYTAEMHQEYRRKEDEKAAKLEQERRERTEKESARRAWLAEGGRAEDFEQQWVQIRDEGRRRRVMDADKRAREEMQLRGVSRI
jgi:hypothetical protein